MGRKRGEAQPSLFDLRCETCGKYLVMTESGYWACLRGHGGLRLDEPAMTEPEADSFLMFLDDVEGQ